MRPTKTVKNRMRIESLLSLSRQISRQTSSQVSRKISKKVSRQLLLLQLLLLQISLAVSPALSEDAAQPLPRNSNAVITAVSVLEQTDNVAIEITFSQLVHADILRLDHPDRLVFNFPGCGLANPGQRLSLNRGSVIAVGSAAFSHAPPVARVVIDLKSALTHEKTDTGNKLIITIKAGEIIGPIPGHIAKDERS